jgi:hypothetical protein
MTPLRIVGAFGVWASALVGLVWSADSSDAGLDTGPRACPVAVADHVEDGVGWCQ